jgi:hypothetical protein
VGCSAYGSLTGQVRRARQAAFVIMLFILAQASRVLCDSQYMNQHHFMNIVPEDFSQRYTTNVVFWSWNLKIVRAGHPGI